MQLPRELEWEILKNLDKTDLKAVRLVSKDWSLCALRYLFERIYWSPQDLDLEVFQNIARRTELASCVKELVFDGSQFIEKTEEQFFEEICTEIWGNLVCIVSSPHTPLSTVQPNRCLLGSRLGCQF